MEVKIINNSNHPLPQYETSHSAGMDLRANLQKPVILNPMERALIPTGLYVEIPMGFEGQVRPRSGLAIKKGVTVLNAPGTIDADYRGELKVILINLSREIFEINDGDRIAQFVIASYSQPSLIEVKELSASKRGSGGFGSTGIN